MLIDAELQFSNRQAVTATAVSTNHVNLGAAGTRPNTTTKVRRDLEVEHIPLLIQVTDTFVGGTSIAVTVEVDDNPAFSSATTVASTAAIPVASLVAGYQFGLREFPARTEQYVRLRYTVAGTMTGGTITAAATAGIQRHD